MTFFSELLIAAFHLPNHSTTTSDFSAHGVGVTSSSWCVLLFLFMLGLMSVSSTFISTVSFLNSPHLSPREYTDRPADPRCCQAAGPTAQHSSETLGQGWNQDGEYKLCSGISRSAFKACWRFMHTLAHLGCVFRLTGQVRPSERSATFTTADINTNIQVCSPFSSGFPPSSAAHPPTGLLLHIERLQA